MKVAALRALFLDYFAKKNHTVLPTSTLVPTNDETLLFTNAGMNQFKDVFLGKSHPGYTRAATAQRCLRAGGKHNDLENVGYTARHHTFFEMLGNFSFGDYFKREAIGFAWEFLTIILKLPPEKLWVTVYTQDDEAADIWLKELKISPERFSRCGDKDNFWSMGDTGPCGPCTEIFYDHGPQVWGGPPGSPDESGDRYIEIWNLVFMQYNRTQDGVLHALPKPSVDTGMGFERLAAVMQGVHSNYEIDLFQEIIQATANSLRVDIKNKKNTHALQVIADHIRACTFLITDGVVPSNEGRGYVLRRIIRRAVRHGNQVSGNTEPFFYQLVSAVVQTMGDAYPELIKAQSQVAYILRQEEDQFCKTLEQGLKILTKAIENQTTGGINNIIPGDLVFKLYDTYGFPMDLTADIAREHNFTIDESGFQAAMAEQRQRARSASQFTDDNQVYANITIERPSEFIGYDNLITESKIIYLIRAGVLVDVLNPGDEAHIILDKTVFYPESGGQVGDVGVITGKDFIFEVSNTQKTGDIIYHVGKLTQGVIHVGNNVQASVDKNKRAATMLNHSATHLLHAALRKIVGTHVTQKGSLVDPDKLRFDFSHTSALTIEELNKIELLVNQKIRENIEAHVEVMDAKKALQTGAMALFGEKYGDKVRVLTMGGDFSVELCGGTHASRTGDIGLMKIISETGIAAGVRRIEAITGEAAFKRFQEISQKIINISQLLKSDNLLIENKIQQLLDNVKKLEKDNASLNQKLVTGTGSDYTKNIKKINGISVIIETLPSMDAKLLKNMIDDLKNKLGSGVIVLATVEGDKISMIAGVTKDCTSRVSAGELISFLAQQVGGKGGGRPDMAQAGGNNPALLPAALKSVEDWLKQKVNSEAVSSEIKPRLPAS